MKILITTDAVGGIWNYTVSLALGLARHQVETVIVCMGPGPDNSQLNSIRNIPAITFYHRPYLLEWMDDPWRDVEKAGNWLLKIKESEKPDLVHLNGFSHAVLDWELPVVVVGHSCVYTWYEAVKGTLPPDTWQTYFEMVQAGMQAADILISPTQTMLTAYKRIYGPVNHSRVIYNGVDHQECRVARVEEPFIFSMGQVWDESKNMKLLVEAAEHIHCPVVIAGSGSLAQLKVSKNLFFLGRLDHRETFKWLKAAGLYVLPVKYEPFGLTFLEAATRRCALVGGDIPTLRELWDDAMLYVNPNDPEGLALTCNQLLEDQDARQNLVGQVGVRAKNYSTGRKIANYLSLYEEMLTEKSKVS